MAARRDGGHRARGDGWAIRLSPGLEQAGLGLDEDGGGVDLVPLGPEPAGPIGPAQALRGVVQLRYRDEQGLPDGQIRRALGHRNPVVGRGEADPLELAVDLGQDVGPREGGPALGDLADGHAGGVGEDLVGQVAGSQQRQVVAVRQPRYPGLRISSDVDARRAGATPRSSRRGGGAP